MPLSGNPLGVGFKAGAAGISSLGAGVQQAAGAFAKQKDQERKGQIDLINSLVKGGLAAPSLEGEEPDFTLFGLNLKLQPSGDLLLKQFKTEKVGAEAEIKKTEADILRRFQAGEDLSQEELKLIGALPTQNIFNLLGDQSVLSGGGAGGGAREFNGVKEAEAAGLPLGTKVTIKGKSATIR